MASLSASQWVTPSTRPEHIEELISGVDRYNPQNLQILNEYLEQQCEGGEYDCLANLAILKLFQFNPQDFDYNVAIQVLLKALTAAPFPDFNLCLALLGEAPLATVQPEAKEEDAVEGESKEGKAASSASAAPSAGNLADPVVVKLSQLSALLLSARFRAFWTAFESADFEDVRGFASNINGFEDAVRAVALRSVGGAFKAISQERLGSYLHLKGSELTSFIEKQSGWSVSSNGTVVVPSNADNEVKATVIREDLQLDQLTKFLSQVQTTPLRA